MANDRDHPARAVDSTQVKMADRGLGVHGLVRPSWALVVGFKSPVRDMYL
jgi:hypothetical protein